MNDGGRDPARPSDEPRSQSAWPDVALLVVVVGVIVAATLFRGTHRTERGTPPEPRAAAAVPKGRSGAVPFGIPGAREDVKQDLRALVVAQEAFYAEKDHYASDISRLTVGGSLRFTSGTTISIAWGTHLGWAASAEGGRLGAGSCVISVGAVPNALRPRTRIEQREGHDSVPRCDGDL